MPKIVFWSPEPKSIGQTLASVALTTVMAIEEDYSNLLLHGHWQAKKIESAFTYFETLKKTNVFGSSSMGITALARLVESNKLTPEGIRNYAKPVLKQRLDIMYGTNVASREQFVQLTKSLNMVIKNAVQTYDLVWIDLPKGTDKDYITEILSEADYVICTINQEAMFLDDSLKAYMENNYIKDKKRMLLVCNYDPRSKYNIPNIRRKYGIKDPMYCIPSNYMFTDACNDGNVIDFIYNNLNADKMDYNGNFIFEVKEALKEILNNVRV